MRIKGTEPGPWTGYLLNLTSQTWLTAAEVDRPVWVHQLLVRSGLAGLRATGSRPLTSPPLDR